MESFVVVAPNKKIVKLALLFGLMGFFLSIWIGIASTPVIYAREFISDNALKDVIGRTKCSLLAGYSLSSIEGRQSVVNIYVVGENRSGFVRFVFNKNEEGYALEKVYFDGVQVFVP